MRASDRLVDAAGRIAAAGGGLAVADSEGRLVGFLSERDVIGAIFPPYLKELHHTGFLTKDFASLLRRAADAAELRVDSVMVRDPETLRATDSESHAAEIFLHQAPDALPVTDSDGRVRGVVRIADVAQSLLEACGALRG